MVEAKEEEAMVVVPMKTPLSKKLHLQAEQEAGTPKVFPEIQ